jgi:hypothetical protein
MKIQPATASGQSGFFKLLKADAADSFFAYYLRASATICVPI